MIGQLHCNTISLIIFFILIHSVFLFSQPNKGKIFLKFNDDERNLIQTQNIRSKDSIALFQSVINMINKWQSEGYITAVLDSFSCKNDSCDFFVHKGLQWKMGEIRMDGRQKLTLDAAGLKKFNQSRASLNHNDISNLQKKLVVHFANNGYPFAKVWLDSVELSEGVLNARLLSETGPFILFDSIDTGENKLVSNHYLQKYLQIKPGKPYNHSKVLQLSNKLNALNFFKLNSPPSVTFINNLAQVNLRISSRPSNRIDFILGVLRQPNSASGNNFIITGDILAEFNNRFGMGEYVFGQFKRLRPENQEVILKSEFPYLPGLPIGSHIDFRIFKFGTENIDIVLNAGGQFIYNDLNQLKFGWLLRSSRLIDVNTNQLLQSGRLPERLDVVYSGVAFSIVNRRLDNRFNPSKGLSIVSSLNGGRRRVIPNIGITSLEGFELSYDSIKLNSTLIDANVSVDYFIPLGSRFTLRSAFNGGIRYNENGIFENEKYRLGGNRLLRGFDEESIFTDRYGFITTEVRLIFDERSYLTLPFLDFGYTRVLVNGKDNADRVLGVGMGLTFGTSAGIFNISFAAGSRLGNSLDFGQMKIHFGYVSLF